MIIHKVNCNEVQLTGCETFQNSSNQVPWYSENDVANGLDINGLMMLAPPMGASGSFTSLIALTNGSSNPGVMIDDINLISSNCLQQFDGVPVLVTSGVSGAVIGYMGTISYYGNGVVPAQTIEDYIFGDGIHGPVDLNGTNTYTFAGLLGSTYTLNQDVHATSFVVESGIILVTNGFRVFATEYITLPAAGSTIQNNGGPASGASGGTANAAGTLSGGANGVNGTVGTGAAGISTTASLGGGGGTGGAPSGAAGTATVPTPAQGGGSIGPVSSPTSVPLAVRRMPYAVLGGFLSVAGFVSWTGGASGSAGGGDGTHSGGGSGAGGGIVLLGAPIIQNSGQIRSRGGLGGNAAAGNASGGGGGGGGAIILICYLLLGSAPGASSACSGGGGGSPHGTGSTGANGLSGNVYIVQPA